MSPKHLYLALALVGLVLPWYFLASFLLVSGRDPFLALEQLWATNITRFFFVDVLLTGLALLVYLVLRERERLRRFWLLVGATVLVGPSCALPLCLYFREEHRE